MLLAGRGRVVAVGKWLASGWQVAGQTGTNEPSEPSDPAPPIRAWTLAPIEDRAYQLHLRGLSYRAIAQQLGIDKDTVNRYVKLIERDVAPRRKADRERWRREAVERLQNVQAHAYEQFDATGEASLLNTIATCEREIARLRGLYDSVVDEGGGGGITITISRRIGPADRSADGGAASA